MADVEEARKGAQVSALYTVCLSAGEERLLCPAEKGDRSAWQACFSVEKSESLASNCLVSKWDSLLGWVCIFSLIDPWAKLFMPCMLSWYLFWNAPSLKLVTLWWHGTHYFPNYPAQELCNFTSSKVFFLSYSADMCLPTVFNPLAVILTFKPNTCWIPLPRGSVFGTGELALWLVGFLISHLPGHILGCDL